MEQPAESNPLCLHMLQTGAIIAIMNEKGDDAITTFTIYRLFFRPDDKMDLCYTRVFLNVNFNFLYAQIACFNASNLKRFLCRLAI